MICVPTMFTMVTHEDDDDNDDDDNDDDGVEEQGAHDGNKPPHPMMITSNDTAPTKNISI